MKNLKGLVTVFTVLCLAASPITATAAVGTVTRVSGTGYGHAVGQGKTSTVWGTLDLGTTAYTTNGIAKSKASIATDIGCNFVDFVAVVGRSSTHYDARYDNTNGKFLLSKDVITVTTGASLTLTGVAATIDMASVSSTVDLPATSATIVFADPPDAATGTSIAVSSINITSATGATVDLGSASATVTLTGVAATLSLTDSPFIAVPAEVANGVSTNWGTVSIIAACR